MKNIIHNNEWNFVEIEQTVNQLINCNNSLYLLGISGNTRPLYHYIQTL